jgi:hypothetical protein
VRAQAEVCPSCGTREVDWVDPATGKPWNPPKFEPATRIDHGCEQLGRLRASLPNDTQQRPGLQVIAVPFTPPTVPESNGDAP